MSARACLIHKASSTWDGRGEDRDGKTGTPARTRGLGLGVVPSTPQGFSGAYRDTDFDGFKFVIYEMLVLLTAALMRYERWEILAGILNERIFISGGQKSEYVSFVHFRVFLESLDSLRNQRLKLNRVSVTSDMLKARFTFHWH